MKNLQYNERICFHSIWIQVRHWNWSHIAWQAALQYATLKLSESIPRLSIQNKWFHGTPHKTHCVQFLNTTKVCFRPSLGLVARSKHELEMGMREKIGPERDEEGVRWTWKRTNNPHEPFESIDRENHGCVSISTCTLLDSQAFVSEDASVILIAIRETGFLLPSI